MKIKVENQMFCDGCQQMRPWWSFSENRPKTTDANKETGNALLHCGKCRIKEDSKRTKKYLEAHKEEFRLALEAASENRPCDQGSEDGQKCPFINRCATQQLACRTFDLWTASGALRGEGGEEPPLPYQRRPTRKIFDQVFNSDEEGTV